MTLESISARKGLATALAAIFAHAALPAGAQQAEKVEKIEVTGSNIKRVDAEGPAPVQIITRQDIERTGSNTVSEVLRQLPSNSAGSYDETFTGSFARGSSGVSLRGLGQKSTLVLINGRRMAVYSFAQNLQDGFVDLNSIPLSAIERIEVLKDGASAIYGSDAIAGVVNVILRKDYTGAEMTVGGGVTSKWDGQEVHVSGAVGFGTPGKDKYNVMLSADYFNREHIWARDRRLLTDADYRDIPGGANFPNSTLSNPGTYLRRPGTTPFGTATRQPFPNCPADRILVFGGTTNCTENTNIYQTAVPETTRAGLFGRATYEFSSSLSAFTELAFNSNETFTQNAPFSVPSTQLGTAVVPGTVNAILPVGNPSNPFSVPIEVRYRFSDVGPRQITNTTDATRIILGLNGGFGAWSWETAAGYTESKSEQRDKNGIRISGLRAVIADGSYNFLNNAANTQATYDRLRVDYSRTGDSKLSFVDAKVSGELMQMANGPLGMAAGLEFRREDYDDVSDPVLTLGDVLGRGSTTAIGKRDITSGYVEFSVPVLKAVEMQLAARTDRYSDFGSSSTPKVGVRWTPSRELLLRATYSKGFRAPSIPESGESNSFFFQTLEDTRKCAINTVYCGGVSTPGTLTANPDLQPEKSDSWTIGFVFEPSQGASLGLDWYHIKQKQLVSNRDLQQILNNEELYARFITRGPPTADDIARGAPGPLVLVAAPFENLAQLETSGIDIDARVRMDSGIGRVTLGLTGSYLHSYKQPLTPEDPPTELAGTYNLPRFKGIGSITLDSGPWSGSVLVNYIRGFKQSTSAGASAAAQIKAWTTVDLQGSYAGLRNTKFVLGVKNAADKEPPIAIAEQFLYTFQQHNLRGLFAYASVNYQFR